DCIASLARRVRHQGAAPRGAGRVTMVGPGAPGQEVRLSQPRSRILVPVSLLLAATLVGGTVGGRLLASPERDNPPLDEDADIPTTLAHRAPLPPGKFVYASSPGMLSRLAPPTAFHEPEDYAGMRGKQQGSFFGLGIQIQKRMGRITVIAPMEGTPAYKMGIRAGDIITHVED